jgi:hypothetical protein
MYFDGILYSMLGSFMQALKSLFSYYMKMLEYKKSGKAFVFSSSFFLFADYYSGDKNVLSSDLALEGITFLIGLLFF